MGPLSSIWSHNRRLFISIGLGVAAVYVIVPQLSVFRDSWPHVVQARLSLVAMAVLLTLLTYVAAAGTYYFLAFKPAPYGQLVIVQLAAMCVNRLLPSGVGAVGANYAYLRHRRHQPIEAGSVVAVNNLLGVTGHLIILVVSLLIFGGRLSSVGLKSDWAVPRLLAIIGAAVLLIAGLAYARWKQALRRSLAGARRQLSSYRSRPAKLAAALSASICLTLCNLLCLAACLDALQLHLSFLSCLIVFSFGVGVGSITPTPGGIGGFEAGLVSSLVAYHLPAASALAAALLYRLVSYWLPLIMGAIAFAACQKQKLFTA